MSTDKTHPLFNLPAIKGVFPDKVSFAAVQIPSDSSETAQQADLQLAAHIRSEKRKQQFLSGRMAAREALRKLGFADGAAVIGRGSNGEPVWPAGITGSISHSESLAVAATGRTDAWSSIGIDIEPAISERKAPIARRVCATEEIDWINACQGELMLRLTRVFSAKESLYKAFFQATGHRLSFEDASLRWNEDCSVALVKFLRLEIQNFLPHQIHVHALESQGLVLTSCLIPHHPRTLP